MPEFKSAFAARPAMSSAGFVREPVTSPTLRRHRGMAPVGPEMESLIGALADVQVMKAGAELLGERDAQGKPRYLLSGWAARVRWMPDGRRQIFGFVLPGESIGICLRPRPITTSITISLTTVQVVDASPVQQAIDGGDPVWDGLREAVHLAASFEEAFLLNQILRLGQQTAYERMCHLLLELRERLQMAGIGDGTKFPMPLTQEVLADATGLSIVHVNRILQQLRRERLLDLHGGQARLLDLPAMEIIADYRRPVSTQQGGRTAPWR
jgi:CRP-like cAMP-binding protein